MLDLKLEFPVVTIDNKQLLLCRNSKSPKTPLKLLSPRIKTKYKQASLLGFKSIKEDMIEFFKQGNYAPVFGDPKTRKTILKLIKKVRMPLPILETIYFFKEYDFYTYRHILMVFALSTLLAIDILKDSHNLLEEILSAPTHDLGKICIPLNVLAKKTALNKTEKKILQQHTLAGYVLLCYYFKDSKNLAAKIARDHHERKDGTGYPYGLHINDLMVEIVMVTDIYDALISPRAYRPTSYDKRTALEELTAMAKDGKINKDIVKALISHNRKNKPHVNDCIVSKQKRGTPPADNQYGIIINDDNKAE